MKKCRLLSMIAAMCMWAISVFAQDAVQSIEKVDLGAKGGTLTFSEAVAFVGDSVTSLECTVVGKETKNIATKATLTPAEDAKALNVTYADDDLIAGEYVLQIPAEKIVGFAGQDVEFKVEGEPIVGPGLTLVESNLTATGGTLKFSEYIAIESEGADMVESFTCYVVGKDTKNIAAQATLSLSWDAWDVLDVTFGEEALEPGTYVLQVPANKVKGNDTGNVFAGQDVEFTVEGEPIVGEGLVVTDYSIHAQGGQITFSESIGFASDGVDIVEEIIVNVVGAKTKNIAAKATLKLSWDAWNVIDVVINEELENGEYALEIPANTIAALDTPNVLAAQNLVFTVENTTGIQTINVEAQQNSYDINGRRANGTRGLVIRNGQKRFVF